MPSSGVQTCALRSEEHTSELQSHDNPYAVSLDRKSTRLNSSHTIISYAVFCLKKKRIIKRLLVKTQGRHDLFNRGTQERAGLHRYRASLDAEGLPVVFLMTGAPRSSHSLP